MHSIRRWLHVIPLLLRLAKKLRRRCRPWIPPWWTQPSNPRGRCRRVSRRRMFLVCGLVYSTPGPGPTSRSRSLPSLPPTQLNPADSLTRTFTHPPTPTHAHPLTHSRTHSRTRSLPEILGIELCGKTILVANNKLGLLFGHPLRKCLLWISAEPFNLGWLRGPLKNELQSEGGSPMQGCWTTEQLFVCPVAAT